MVRVMTPGYPMQMTHRVIMYTYSPLSLVLAAPVTHAQLETATNQLMPFKFHVRLVFMDPMARLVNPVQRVITVWKVLQTKEEQIHLKIAHQVSTAPKALENTTSIRATWVRIPIKSSESTFAMTVHLAELAQNVP